MKKETAYLSTSKDFLANLNVKNKVTEVNFFLNIYYLNLYEFNFINYYNNITGFYIY